MQSRGLWGPRGIEKNVLELPIPQFNPEKPFHQELSELGRTCSAKVEQWLKGGGAGKITSIGKLRGMAREVLRDKLKEIDGMVKKILE